MRILKIYKTQWDEIISGTRRWEFRKLTKGITNEKILFVSMDVKFVCPDHEDPQDNSTHYDFHRNELWCDECAIWQDYPEDCIPEKYKLGTAELMPMFINPCLGYVDLESNRRSYYFENDKKEQVFIPSVTFYFLLKNYHKHWFVASKIIEAKKWGSSND